MENAALQGLLALAGEDRAVVQESEGYPEHALHDWDSGDEGSGS